MDKICERVTKGKVESDKLFVELEEKCMKLDYEMMRMEQDEGEKKLTEQKDRNKNRENCSYSCFPCCVMLIRILFIPIRITTMAVHDHNRLHSILNCRNNDLQLC